MYIYGNIVTGKCFPTNSNTFLVARAIFPSASTQVLCARIKVKEPGYEVLLPICFPTSFQHD